MAAEYIDFRRAFVWLLCGMLLPSVALIAFGVVAVANERAAVERRLTTEYGARLQALEQDLLGRLQAAGATAAAAVRAQDTAESSGPSATRADTGDGPTADPLVASVGAPEPHGDPGLADALRRAATLPIGGRILAASESSGDRKVYALIHSGPADRVVAAQLDLVVLVAEVPKLGAARFPRERATFRLLPQAVRSPSLTLRRLLDEVSPRAERASVVARLALDPPLEGFVLAAELSGDDPAATLAFRNRTWYIAALVLLYAGIGIGFGLTIREMRRAYKLSRLKTDFVANISHELRTPLTSVRLFAETLREGRAQGAEVQECLDQLTMEAQRLSTLVEKLLDWSRLESGRKVLRREPTRVEKLLDQVAGVFRAQQLGASYETEVEPELPAISVDRDAMAQVVFNLLHNAVKYTGVDKQIRLRARRSGPKAVAIEVEDNGVGVRPQDRKRIFDRFYRADNLLSRRTEGAGLGLAISKRIVEAHGGRLEVESREGHGSVFRVRLPAS